MAGKKRQNGSRVPKGDEFMKGTTTEEIEKAIKREKHPKAVRILLACLYRRKGKAGTTIADILHTSPSAVYAWLSRMHQGGLEARYDKPKAGRPRKIGRDRCDEISRKIDERPKASGIESGVWTGRLIIIMLLGIGIECVSPSTAYRTMRYMDKSWRTPGRPFDYRAPTDEVKAKFKQDLVLTVLEYMAAGYRLFFLDESHCSTKTARGRTWMSRGLLLKQAIKSFGRRYTCLGALGPEGFFWKYCERGNTGTMIGFVRETVAKHGRILLVMDNASYHKSKAFVREMAKLGGAVKIVYLPTYSPDLNPVEMVWKELKKYIANGFYKKVEDMTGALVDFGDLYRSLFKSVF